MLFASLDRSKNKTITYWAHEHQACIQEWNEGSGPAIDPEPHNALAFERYLAWLNGATRLHLNLLAFADDVDNACSLPLYLVNHSYNPCE